MTRDMKYPCDYGSEHSSREAMRLCDLRYNDISIEEEYDPEDLHDAITEMEDEVWSNAHAIGGKVQALDTLLTACRARVDDDELQVLVGRYDG